MLKANEPLFGLIDCNNFYVSCEKLFQPKLKNRPVIVLSSNDGCVVSRSNLAKALQIKMGVPIFQIKDLIQRYDVACLSSNYSLYANLSSRVMQVLGELVPAIEIYSIDEAFIDLTGFDYKQLLEFSKKLINTVKQYTGIPVSLGIGPTKTLAKVANRIAKRDIQHGNVFIINESNRNKSLAQTPVEDIWGIGRQWSKKIHEMGVENAYQLSLMDAKIIRKISNKVLAATVLELQGKPTLNIEKEISAKKQIIVSRSFGREVAELSELKEAISFHLSQAMEKLRNQKLVTRHVTIFVQTNKFKTNFHGYHHQAEVNLPLPSQNTKQVLKLVLTAINKLYCKGSKYKKAGVMLSDISKREQSQSDLFSDYSEKDDNLMELLDKVNNRMGSGKIRFAIEGYKKSWQTKTAFHSFRYTTCWNELPIVKAT